jgi:crotonyl-CoA carboxylase/reductase
MRQKRLQGSHFANDEQAAAFNQLVLDGRIDPCLGETYTFDQIPLCHQLMSVGKQPPGVMAALVSAAKAGLKELE